ncbi:phosphoribosylpyrophosphate synthetase [Hymenobacter armeniacus]|uniref:Phosphoribosylpyrophosphate synthetase n=1 Tax=Hymenobacter armeniacus TaxID=2771358 RepID=A0ABR8JM45_9BACT|nr:phosphoribosylpyrophosphate synthetase [Hymenobacter armeniacus]MBD2721072.1 phosphoribosylpyrophosphate synthetase [Hymenobacter armeniacus]
MQPQTYASESAALRDLARRGYVHDFNLTGPQQPDPSLDIGLNPDRFHIREVYRFEGESNPADECVVYAIESDSGAKGVLINAYGSDDDAQVSELVQLLAPLEASAQQPVAQQPRSAGSK